MKFHWGHGVIIAFILFATLIISLVVGSIRQNVELVSPDYYAQEIRYQNRIEEIKNNQNLDKPAEIIAEKEQVVIKIFTANPIGNVVFFRPSDATKDFSLPLNVQENSQIIPTQNLEKGLWRVKITWESDKKTYFHEQKIDLK